MSDYVEYSDDKQFKLEVWETNKASVLGLCKWQVYHWLPDLRWWETMAKYTCFLTIDRAIDEGQRALAWAIQEVADETPDDESQVQS